MGALSRLKALETPIVFDNLGLLRGSLTGLFYGAHLALFASKTLSQIRHSDDQSVTPTARPGLKYLQGAVDVLAENIGRLGSNFTQGL